MPQLSPITGWLVCVLLLSLVVLLSVKMPRDHIFKTKY